MKILAFDQAIAVTGFAIFNDTELTDYGIISLKKEKDSENREQKMMVGIASLIADNAPDYVVFEGVMVARNNAQTMMKLAQVQGCILSFCYIRKIPVRMLSPGEWRKALGFQQGRKIKRPELKQQAKAYVKDNYNLDVTEDEADAICIGRALYLGGINDEG